MVRMVLLIVFQCLLLCSGQVLLKIAMNAMGSFSFTWRFFVSQLTNLWFAGCGVCFASAGLLWMYILKHYPFSLAYPLTSISFVFGMLAAAVFLDEQTDLMQWIGVLLVVVGCVMIVR